LTTTAVLIRLKASLATLNGLFPIAC